MGNRTFLTSLCLFLVLAVFAATGLGQSIGSFSLENDAVGVLEVLSTVTLNNGEKYTDPQWNAFPAGITERGKVGTATVCISDQFKLTTPSGVFTQTVPIWCDTGMPVFCLPDCDWTIDETGFSVQGFDGDNVRVYDWARSS